MAKVFYTRSTKSFTVCIISTDPITKRPTKHTTATRGTNIEDVLDHYLKMYPDAVSILVETIDGSERGRYRA